MTIPQKKTDLSSTQPDGTFDGLTPLLTIAQAAALLAVNPRTIRRAIVDGALPARRIRRAVRIEMTALRTFIQSN